MKFNLPQNVQRQVALTEGNEATPFGCCNFFDGCGDGNLFSLYYRGGLDLLDWMGFNPTQDCYRTVEFINYVRPEQDDGECSEGHIHNACDDPNGIEFGYCHLSVEDFGIYGRESAVRKIIKTKNYCKTRPRYFLDGSPITDEKVWDLTFVMDQILNDIRLAVITGNIATPGQFDGLQRWVRTGYDCAMLDSYVVDWAGNDFDGAGGGAITLNGAATPGGFGIVDFLLDLNRNINQRISWSPPLKQQFTNRGADKIILLPTFLGRCLLDSYTCWAVCPSNSSTSVNINDERRKYRNSLNGGRFGHGKIYLDGEEISLLNYDWGMINGARRGDMYLLTGSIGSQRIWEGEHISANNAMEEVDLSGMGGTNKAGDYFVLDDGRVLGKFDFDNLCRITKLWMFPRLFCMAPWAQVRFIDVECTTPSGPLSPNPCDSSFFPEISFSQAQCP